MHDAIFTGLQVPGIGPNIYEPSSWRAMFEEFEGGPPCRQELEWWRAACVMKQSITRPPAWFPAIAAMIDAIDAMLPDAADGPSSERYPSTGRLAAPCPPPSAPTGEGVEGG